MQGHSATCWHVQTRVADSGESGSSEAQVQEVQAMQLVMRLKEEVRHLSSCLTADMQAAERLVSEAQQVSITLPA